MSDRINLLTDDNDDGYRIERREHGIAVFGSVPTPELNALLKVWRDKYGYDVLAQGVAYALCASLVATSEERRVKWRTDIEEKLIEKYDDPLDRWASGCRTGISSRTIYSVLRNVEFERMSLRRAPPDVPHDAADFERCVDLLDIAPDEWRGRLKEVADEYPAWEPIVCEWGWLEERLAEGDRRKINARLDEINNREADHD